MSFASELSTLMNSNTDINKSVSGIYRETTSTEFNAKKNWIIYTYKRNNNIAVLSNPNAMSVYSLYTEVYTNGGATTESICEALMTYLTNYVSDSIRDINFMNETHSIIADANENVAFVTMMEFEITRQN